MSVKKAFRKLFISIKKIILFFLLISILGGLIVISLLWRYYYAPNIKLEKTPSYLYIKSTYTFDDVCNELTKKKYIKNLSTFIWLAKKYGYDTKVKAGRYRLKDKMNNKQLVTILKSGKQEPVRLTINNIRTIEQLAGKVSYQIEADSLSIISLLNDNKFLQKIHLNRNNVISIFLPNTYFIKWNSTAEEFVERMQKEFEHFWNSERISKANDLKLSPTEVIILASIVEEESNFDEEYPIIAGVYINRLRRGMLLQADPTVKFAHKNFALKRILKKHLEINSPFNTYKYSGLPPGPICIPSLKAIDGVLNYKKHNYLYFCANADLSGKHIFSTTLKEHNHNAQLYQRALNKQKIFK